MFQLSLYKNKKKNKRKNMKKPNGYWNIKENVFAEAKKYKTKIEFKKGCSGAYKSAYYNGWFADMPWLGKRSVCNFYGKKPRGYWTRERVFEESKKYKTRSEFKKNCPCAYSAARQKGWLNEMKFEDGRLKLFTDKIDSVYKYYFKETNSVYVGRTLMRRQNKRDKEHLYVETDSVYVYAKENSLAVPPMEIIEDKLTIEEGQEREAYWVEYYKENGYNVLNVAKTGSLGTIGYGKWTKENVFAEAKKYKTRTEFFNNSIQAYRVARYNEWFADMPWLVEGRKPNNYWTKETVFNEAKKYKTRSEFKKNCPGAYKVAMVNILLDELFPKKSVA